MFKLRRKYIDSKSIPSFYEDQQQFINFKYKGGTDSITYEHLWGPFAEYLLKFFPLWVAPNLITFSSLILLVIVHLVFMFCGSNENGVSNWKLIMMAVSIIIYQNLDNIDGKQARRTRTGSPLGMLFDHGVDSLCSFLLTLQLLEIIRIKNFNITIFCVFIFIMAVFFSAMWNQYSTGVFKLGRINPVDQGLPALALGSLSFIFISTKGLEQFHIFAPLNQEILIFMGGILAILLISMNKDIFKNAIRPKMDVLQTFSLLIFTGIALVLVHLIDSETYFNRNGLQVYYSLLFFWSRNMIEIQLYYISGQKFKVYNRGTNIFLFTLIGYLVYGKALALIGISAEVYFWLVLVINAVVFLEFVLNVLKQGAQILNINILTIKQKDA